jgi:peptidoglycan/LPS O-acetylase OafA/YrhL
LAIAPTLYLIHHIIINIIGKNAPWLATAKPLLVLVTFEIATLYAAILDVYVDSYFRRLRKKKFAKSPLNQGVLATSLFDDLAQEFAPALALPLSPFPFKRRRPG